MALLVILVCMGAGYTLLTSSPAPVRNFELTAVWVTLGLIAAALLATASPMLTLPLAIFFAVPLWYLTIRIGEAQARSEVRDTEALWRDWRATTGAHRNPAGAGAQQQVTLGARLDGFGHGELIEEIEITEIPAALASEPLLANNLELAPVDDSTRWQRQRM